VTPFLRRYRRHENFVRGREAVTARAKFLCINAIKSLAEWLAKNVAIEEGTTS